MMGDIVKSLHACAEDYWGDIACDAASEIERLRERVEKLEAFATEVLQHGPYNWQNSARAALLEEATK